MALLEIKCEDGKIDVDLSLWECHSALLKDLCSHPEQQAGQKRKAVDDTEIFIPHSRVASVAALDNLLQHNNLDFPDGADIFNLIHITDFMRMESMRLTVLHGIALGDRCITKNREADIERLMVWSEKDTMLSEDGHHVLPLQKKDFHKIFPDIVVLVKKKTKHKQLILPLSSNYCTFFWEEFHRRGEYKFIKERPFADLMSLIAFAGFPPESLYKQFLDVVGFYKRFDSRLAKTRLTDVTKSHSKAGMVYEATKRAPNFLQGNVNENRRPLQDVLLRVYGAEW